MLEELKKYFSIKELVSESVYNKHGESAWKFICPMLIHTLLVIRKEIDKPITINNWANGGKFQQRGLRENTSNIVRSKTKSKRLYLSAHTMGKAIDFDVKGMTAVEVREWLKNHYYILPYKIRLENEMNGKPITWVHADLFQEENNPKVYLFNV